MRWHPSCPGYCVSDSLVPGYWEWRAFAPEFDLWAVVWPPETETVDQTAIVSPHSDALAVIHDDTLTVHQLEQRAADGVEQWRPSMTVTFPICQHDVRDVLRELGVIPPTLYRPQFDASQFVTDVASCTDGVRVIGVRICRRRVALDGATLERATLSLAGRVIQTVALRAADADVVRSYVQRLRLERYQPTNIVEFLKQLLLLESTTSGWPSGDLARAS